MLAQSCTQGMTGTVERQLAADAIKRERWRYAYRPMGR